MNEYKIQKYLFKASQGGGSKHTYRQKLNYYSQNGGGVIDNLENAISEGIEFCEPPPPGSDDYDATNTNINTSENVLYIIQKKIFNLGYIIKIKSPYNTFFGNNVKGMTRVEIKASPELIAYVNNPATNGNILIHTAAKMLNKLMFGLLVNYAGAYIIAKDTNGNNAFHYAYKYNNKPESEEFINFVLTNFSSAIPLVFARNNLNQTFWEGFSDVKVQSAPVSSAHYASPAIGDFGFASAASAPAPVAQPPKNFLVGRNISNKVYTSLFKHVIKPIKPEYMGKQYIIYKNAKNGISIQLMDDYSRSTQNNKMSMGVMGDKIMIWHNANPNPSQIIPDDCAKLCDVLNTIIIS